MVITERKDHLDLLADRLSKFAKNVIVLRGGMSAPQSWAAFEGLATIPTGEERLMGAMGRYLGEGFDEARPDTLFLTMPISSRGILAQYAGRLHRLHTTKRDVVIYDYVDGSEPILAKMAAKLPAIGASVIGRSTVQCFIAGHCQATRDIVNPPILFYRARAGSAIMIEGIPSRGAIYGRS